MGLAHRLFLQFSQIIMLQSRWTMFTRKMHSCVPKATVEDAIRAVIQADTKTPIHSIKLGDNPAFDVKVILAASNAAMTTVPDNVLQSLKTCGQLIQYLCRAQSPSVVKGIPKFELFAGDEPPPNVTLFNYRKKKWTDLEYRKFLENSMKDAGLLQK